MAKLGIIKHIDSAHGRKIHGHTFKIEIVLKGLVKNEMVDGIDFHEIMPKIDYTLKTIDKKYLNDIPELGRATVENIAIYIINNLSDVKSLDSVTVWEGLDKYATIYKNEI